MNGDETAASGRGDPSDPTNGSRDPAFRTAMTVIGLLLLLSVAGVVHSLLATFGA